MVAKITTPKSINRALNYNEQKVKWGKAECLYAGNFLHDANELNFSVTTSSIVILICFQNSVGVIGNSMGVSCILLHFLVHNRNSENKNSKANYGKQYMAKF